MPILLTIITLAELFVTKQISDSVILWVCYGIYKVITNITID